MTADSYSPNKEQIKETKMVNTENKDVVLEVEDRHFLFKCLKQSYVEKTTQCLAELFGTAGLVFGCCMGCVTGMGTYTPHLQIALNAGLSVLIVVTIFGCVSGGHVNPAVTVAAYIYNLVSLPMAFAYIGSQVIGGLIGFGLLKAVTPIEVIFASNTTIGVCTTHLNDIISPVQGMLVEFVITALLIWVVCALWDPRNSRWQDSATLKLGFTVASMVIIAGPYTGASMNPARSLAPAVFNNNFENHWIYWVGPLTGSLFAALTYRFIFRREAPKSCCTIDIVRT